MAVMLFEWVFTSAFLILVVLALRAALGKRMSAGLRYALWAVVLVRLLVPMQLFTSPIAGTWVMTEKHTEKVIYNVGEHLPSQVAEEDAIKSLGGQNGPSVTLTTFPQAPNPPSVPDAPEPPSPPDLTKAPAWLGWAWLAGGVVVAFVLLVSNLRFYWVLRRERIPMGSVNCPLRVYVAVGLPSPCLFGLFRPAIYVTPDAAANPDMLRHVLAHEYTHYRHGDHLWSLLRCAALAAHWWNPLVWLAAVLSQRDAELACDEGALKRLGDGERAGYGATLLALVTAKPGPGDLFRCATTMAGDKKSLKERITRIAKTPQRILWAAAVAVAVTALACLCAFGQAGEESDEPSPSPAPTPAPTAMQVVPAYSGEEGIPEQVQRDAAEFVRSNFESLRDNGVMFGLDGAVVVPDPPVVDGWRMDSPTGPYWSGETYWAMLGVDRKVELWNVVYFFHTTTPEKVTHLGNAEVTEDGWIGPINYGAECLLYELDDDGNRTLLTTRFEEGGGFVGSVEFRRKLRIELSRGGVPEDMQDRYFVEEHADFPLSGLDLGVGVDLNRNGVPELVQLVEVEAEGYKRLEVWEGNQLLWTGEGFHAHAGWIGYFLCNLDGKEYLLRYTPTMYHGVCNYSYQLFTLDNGVETMVKENSIEFDTNMGTPVYTGNFDPEAIAAFMDEINGLLAHSVQLMNTDEDLAPTFEKEGRLYDSLGWLDRDWGTFARDPAKSLLENLQAFKETMEKAAYADTPTLFPVDELGTDIRLDYRDKSVRFQCPGWAYDYQCQLGEPFEGQILDLNGDGRDEIVVVLIWGHGSGCLIENLYVFDAETLEQYDTSGLNETILNSIESTGDEDNFCLSAPWMDRVTIPRSAAGEEMPNAPMAETLGLGEVVEYGVEQGRLYCFLACDASGLSLNYIGTLRVALEFSPSGDVRCVGGRYTPYEM